MYRGSVGSECGWSGKALALVFTIRDEGTRLHCGGEVTNSGYDVSSTFPGLLYLPGDPVHCSGGV